jgi:hypothetical protein
MTNYYWCDLTGALLPLSETTCTSCRLLVVIDPEDREQVERLIVAYYAQIDGYRYSTGDLPEKFSDNMRAALREFANPTPKPDEPMGLGAVVEDANGRRWVLTECDSTPGTLWWVRPGVSTPHWSFIDAVKVLSPGVPVE